MILASTSNFACISAFGVNSRFAVGHLEKAKITQYNNRIWITIFSILYFFKLSSKSIISLLFGELLVCKLKILRALKQEFVPNF